MRPWRVVDSSIVLDRKWLTVREERIELPHGGEIDEFHVIAAPDWTGMLALTDDDHVVMVEQYRHGAGRVSRELPAGVIDAHESALDAAIRELREETGYEARDWEPLITINTEPSRHTNRAHFFFGRHATSVAEQELDASEHIRVVPVPLRDVYPSIERGEIFHGVHVTALLLAAHRGLIRL